MITTVALTVRRNRKEQHGANSADHENFECNMSADDLVEAHNVLDVTEYLREVNRSFMRTLHDTVFPGGSETIVTTRLRSILKTPQAVKIMADEEIEEEKVWSPFLKEPWRMPGMQMRAKLTYRFEGMTEMINGAFMDDLGGLLSSVTGHRRRILYEIDQDFEKMCDILSKTFTSIKSFMPFLHSSFRQTIIRKLSKVGKDKEA